MNIMGCVRVVSEVVVSPNSFRVCAGLDLGNVTWDTTGGLSCDK